MDYGPSNRRCAWCSNTAKAHKAFCSPCFERYKEERFSSPVSSYSRPSSGGGEFPMVAVVCVIVAVILWLAHAVVMGVWHFINGLWHALPTVDEAEPACKMVGGLFGMDCWG